MSQPFALTLPHLRRIVTTHDTKGNSIIQSDTEIPSEVDSLCLINLWDPDDSRKGMELVRGGRSAAIWVTTDSVPTDDNNRSNDGAKRVIEEQENFGLVPPTGTNLRSTELAPGGITGMHRTCSLDYNILISGELVLINEDGTEKHLKNPGDTVIQKGTMHAWRNPSKHWARWITVLIAADPVIVNGKQLVPEFKH